MHIKSYSGPGSNDFSITESLLVIGRQNCDKSFHFSKYLSLYIVRLYI